MSKKNLNKHINGMIPTLPMIIGSVYADDKKYSYGLDQKAADELANYHLKADATTENAINIILDMSRILLKAGARITESEAFTDEMVEKFAWLDLEHIVIDSQKYFLKLQSN